MHYLLAADIDRKIDAQNRYPYIPEAGDNVLSLFQCEKHEPLSPRPPYVLSSQRCYDVCKTQILMTRRVWQPLLVTDAPPLMRSTYSLRAGPITLKGHSTIHAVSASLCRTNLVYFPKWSTPTREWISKSKYTMWNGFVCAVVHSYWIAISWPRARLSSLDITVWLYLTTWFFHPEVLRVFGMVVRLQ